MLLTQVKTAGAYLALGLLIVFGSVLDHRRAAAGAAPTGTIPAGAGSRPAKQTLPAGQAEELRQLVEKVLKAHGGEAKLRQHKALTQKVHRIEPNGEESTWVQFVQAPDHYRYEILKHAQSGTFGIFDGQQLQRWRKLANGQLEPIPLAGLELDRNYWLDTLEFFGPRRLLRLKDPGHHLNLLPEIQVHGRPAVGIALRRQFVAFRVTLNWYFDKETGLLVKEQNLVKRIDTYFRNYKDCAGIPVARREVLRQNNQVIAGDDIEEVRLPDQLDAKLFQVKKK